MQFKSSFARLAAFAFFLLSLSLLICAAPAPVPAEVDALAVRGDESLAVRADSATNQAKTVLTSHRATLKNHLNQLTTCGKSPSCNYTPILGNIVITLDGIIVQIKAIVALGLKIDATVIVDLWVAICLDILIALKACVGLTVVLVAQLAIKLAAFIQLLLDVCINASIKALVLVKLKAAIGIYVNLCLSLGLNVLLQIVGLIGL